MEKSFYDNMPVGKFGYKCTNCPANMLGDCIHDDCAIRLYVAKQQKETSIASKK